MTRLAENDVRDLTGRLDAFEHDLVAAGGLTLRELAQRTVDLDQVLAASPPAAATTGGGSVAAAWPPARFVDLPTTRAVPFDGVRIAAVPVSTGEGFIPGFCECVAAILLHIGCDARVTGSPDVRGLQEAADGGDEVVFVADDFRFIALNIRTGVCADDDPATADGYTTALAAAAGGLAGKPVLLLGLGPVGRAAGRRTMALGAELYVVERDPAAADRARAEGLAFSLVDLGEGLARCDLLVDATPAAGIVHAADLRDGAIAAVPGVPSAFDAGARARLGVRHIHEPLAVGVAVMAARALSGR
jgi:pyrrolysine biosynthesis protein PylD